MQLRPYQVEAKNAILNEWRSLDKTLLVLTTGLGKTIVFTSVIADRVRDGSKALILAHREELLNQAAEKLLKNTGLLAEFEQGNNSSIGTDSSVVIASIQTMMQDNRLNQFRPDEFSTIVIDEAHHALSASYQKVLQYFNHAKVLGVTATPDRADKKTLAQFFESVAYEYTMREAIRNGYLCQIKALMCPVNIDLTNVKESHGDYQAGDVGRTLEPYLEQIADTMAEKCQDRKTVVFLPLVEMSKHFANLLNARGLRAVEVNGESTDRSEVISDFESGKYNVICNSMLLCLDKETEILTTKGFLNSEELTMEDAVANWCSDGSVFFEKPKDIVHRFLEPNEHMVAVETSRTNFRVTNTHRMIVNYGANRKGWKKIAAEELNNRHVLPAYGLAAPLNITVEQEDNTSSKHAINNCVYHLTQKGMPRDEAKAEAIKRAEDFQKLRYKNPDELTLDECRFIGFWIADGSAKHLQRGGIEYVITQSQRYTHICEWIDRIIQNCGFDVIKKTVRPDKKTSFRSFTWSLSRGTGRGIQKRKGVYSIEPYLKKDGTNLFWGLNEKQFDALIEGFWFGDGFHGDGKDGLNGHFHATNTNKKLIDLFCAIGSVRGWKCTVQTINFKNKNFHTQYGLTMIKGKNINLSEKTVIKHENYANEEVWCVRTTSKNIITRRKGKVTVMGNTEGWDCPAVDCIVVLRPTKSRALYTQIIGRGLRLYEGKTHLLLLDFLWMTAKHDLCRPSCLMGKGEEYTAKVDKTIELSLINGEPVDILETNGQAERDVFAERQKALAEELERQRHKKARLVDPLQYFYSIDDQDLADYEPVFKWEQEPITDKQKELLEKRGINPDTVECKGKAKKIIDTLFSRQNAGLSTPKQIRLLERYGLKNVGLWKFDEATNVITEIKNNGWKLSYRRVQELNNEVA